MAKVLTKSQIIQSIADAHKDKLARKDVARVLESLTTGPGASPGASAGASSSAGAGGASGPPASTAP